MMQGASFGNESKIGQIKSFLVAHEVALNNRKKEFRNTASVFSNNLTNEFLRNRKQIIQDTMERLYEKERDKIHSKLLGFEKQSGFKTEVEQWESRVKQ
jgi:hypothetical protein